MTAGAGHEHVGGGSLGETWVTVAHSDPAQTPDRCGGRALGVSVVSCGPGAGACGQWAARATAARHARPRAQRPHGGLTGPRGLLTPRKLASAVSQGSLFEGGRLSIYCSSLRPTSVFWAVTFISRATVHFIRLTVRCPRLRPALSVSVVDSVHPEAGVASLSRVVRAGGGRPWSGARSPGSGHLGWTCPGPGTKARPSWTQRLGHSAQILSPIRGHGPLARRRLLPT